jgi:putative transposase
MLRFLHMPCLQNFAAVHSSVHNHLNQERHFYSRDNSKLNRSAAFAEWRKLCAVKVHAFGGKLRLVRIRLTAPR